MSPLEVYHQGERILVVEPGGSDTLRPVNTNKRFLLECAANNSRSVVTELRGSVRFGNFLLSLSEQPEPERTVVQQGQSRVFIFNRGTRRETTYGFKQVPMNPAIDPWQRTGRSG